MVLPRLDSTDPSTWTPRLRRAVQQEHPDELDQMNNMQLRSNSSPIKNSFNSSNLGRASGVRGLAEANTKEHVLVMCLCHAVAGSKFKTSCNDFQPLLRISPSSLEIGLTR